MVGLGNLGTIHLISTRAFYIIIKLELAKKKTIVSTK